MQWFIVSRDMHVLCAPSTKAPNSISIYNDKQTISITNNAVVSTYEFTINQKHPDAKYFLLGNYIAFRDKYGDTKLYTMKEHQGDDLQQTWICEDIGMDLINATADKWDYSKDPHPIAWYYENLVLKDTGWTLGVNEISNLSRGLSFDGQSDTLLTRAGDIANQFDGAEINFTVKMSGSQVISQNVNIYKKIGSGIAQEKFIDQKNLISLNYNGTIDNLCTSLIGYGGTPESTGDNTSEQPPIDISGLAYDDGQFWTVKGDKHLYDRVSHKTWTRFRAYYDSSSKSTDGYINGIFTYDTTDPQELLNRMITELKSRNHPSETYEATLLKLGADIGDYIQVAHNNYNPPIYLSARVQQVENCYTAEGQDIGILGDYTRMQSNIDPRVQQLIDGLANSVKSNYTWIRYAKDDKGTGMTATPTTDTKYVAIVSNKPTGVPSDDPAEYAGHWQLIKGSDGKDGIPGATGADGKTSYTHFAYANNVSGTADFSLDDPTGRSYMGVYSDFTKADSTNPDDYIWSFTKGETGPEGMQGAQGPQGDIGIPGKPGADGKTSYTHVAYADNNKGGGFSQLPANKAYMGWYTDFTANDSTDPTKYAWSLIKGSDGLDGAQGIPGPKGADGKTPYTHIAYADTAIGGGLSQLPDGKKYIGMYVDFTENDSSDPNKYAWSLIKGDDGKDGVAGKDGVGIKSTQIMYAQSASGTTAPTTGWTAQVPTLIKGQYLWTQTTWVYTDNTGESGYTVSYNAKDGNNGSDGIAGKDGVGIKSTTITYQASTSGTTAPTGTWVSNPPSVTGGNYLWTRTIWSYTDGTNETGYSIAKAGEKGDRGLQGLQGTDGKDGIPGKPGADGKSSYTHIAYADSATGGGFSQQANGKAFIGMYVDFEATDSTDVTKYNWSLIKGEDGSDGTPGKPGADGKTPYFHIAYADSADGKEGFYAGGGTNLLSNSRGKFQPNKSKTDNYIIYDLMGVSVYMTQGQQYTVHADASSGLVWSGNHNPSVENNNVVLWLVDNAGVNAIISDDNTGTKTTFTWGYPSGTYYLRVNTYKSDNSGYVENVMLEKGAVVHPWSPAPSEAHPIYMGTYTDFTVADSADHTKYAWSLIKGADGINGKDGIPGKAGIDGRTPYFHTAWATSADGKNGFSLTDSANKSYLGTYTDFTKADSTDTTRYAWSLIKGRDGSNGAPGKAGTDGKTPYFHQAWADSKDGKINFSTTDPTNRGYLGTYSDFTQADSTDPTKYFWVELVGNLQVGVRNLLKDTANFSDGVNSSWTVVTDEVYNGNRVLKAPQLSASMSYHDPYTPNTIDVAKGEYYALSFYAKTDAPSMVMRCYFFSPSNTISSINNQGFTSTSSDGLSTFTITNQWKQYWVVWKTNINTTAKRVIIGRREKSLTGSNTGAIFINSPMLVEGNKAVGWQAAPEDTQQQIDTINKGLRDTNSKIAAVTKVDAQAGAPTNPKKGDQWWVKDANGEINAFKIWDGAKWAPSTITQSLLVIKTLDAVNINGSVINGSKFTNAFTFKSALDVTYTGVTTIADGAVKITYKIPSTNEIGTTQITAEGYKQELFNSSGSRTGLSMLSPNSLQLQTNGVGGFLTPDDLIRYGPEEWFNSDTSGNKYTMRFERRWGRVWVSGEFILPYAKFGTGGNGYRVLFRLKTAGLRPRVFRYISGIKVGDLPSLGMLEVRPSGDVVAIGVPNAGRASFEGISYAVD